MIDQRLLLPVALLVATCWTMTAQEAIAQKTEKRKAAADAAGADDWYYQSPNEVTPIRTIPQQKAQFRAQQRMSRLAAQRWYGYSNSRPQVAAMPFTAMYRPAWQRPGGRPYRWHANHTVVVITR